MSVIDLRRCPICQAQSSLVRQKIKLQGERHIAYECLECDSLLLWLGDDLWLQADRWAYQKIGRADMEYLLQRSMTAEELRALANREDAPDDGKRPIPDSPAASAWKWQPRLPVVGPRPPIEGPRRDEQPPLPQIERPASAGWAPTASHQATSPAKAGASESYRPAEPPWSPEWREDESYYTRPEPAYSPHPEWVESQPAVPRHSRGSPFLVLSVALVLLCLICSSIAIIASTTFTGRAPLAVIQPAASPSVELVPNQVLAATETALPAESPVPTETPEPVPTETAQPVPTEPAALQFQGVTDHVSATGTHYVVGEVFNTSPTNLRFVQILATFYDDNDQVIGGGATFTELSIVEAGSSAPFKLATLDPPAGLTEYELSFDYQTTTEDLLALEIVDFSSFSDEAGWHHIVGDVRNDHGFAVKFPKIVATYYNASHDVIRVEMVLSQLNTIQAGETSPFEVVLADPPPDLHHYALHTEALRQ